MNNGVPGKEEFSDNLPELRERAEVLRRAGRFRIIRLSRWDAGVDDWVEIEAFDAE